MSAKCSVCGASVGCSCQLTNGMCNYCLAKAPKEAVKTKHVATKLS